MQVAENGLKLHNISKDELMELAAKSSEQTGNCFCVRESEKGTRLFVDMITPDKTRVTIVPCEMGKRITTAEEMISACMDQLSSEERSRAFVRGEVDGSVFEGYRPAEADILEK